MPVISISGKAGTTKKFSAVVSPGTSISFVVPVKSFIVKPMGGTVYFKFNSTDSDADAFPLTDGESVAMDLLLPFPIASNTSTVGTIFTTAGTVDVYVIATY